MSLCLSLTVIGADASVWAKADPSGVWRGNSRTADYNLAPIRTAPSVAWQYQLPKESLFTPPTLAGDTLYLTAQDAMLRALNVSTRQERWSQHIDGGVAGLLVNNGTLYVTADKALLALDASTGAQKWAFPVDSGTSPAPPAVADGGLFFAQSDGIVRAVDMSTGKEKWHSANGGGVPTIFPLAYADSTLYEAGNTSLIALGAATGAEKWRVTKTGGQWYDPAVSGGVVYAAYADNFMYALNAGTGAEVWIADNILYLQSWFGKIYALVASPASSASSTPGAAPTTTVVPAVAIPGNGSQMFPETGKTVKGLFLDYWKNHGGLPQQGYPISELMGEVSDLQNGGRGGKVYTVQYFERAVFEMHPENQSPYDVLLSQLGTFRYKNKYSSSK